MAATLHHCFAVTAPGLERVTAAELTALGIVPRDTQPGGVGFEAGPGQLYAANLELRTAARILVRIAEFPSRAFYELERKAARVPWAGIVQGDAPVRFRVTSRKSRLYHADAIAQRLHAAVSGAALGAGGAQPSSADDLEEDPDPEAQLFVVRVYRDIVTISADSSGALLHRRGYRQAVGKAPLRETFAAAMLLAAGYDGGTPLVDPFCGSGTIPIEAALLARRIAPGLGRTFAFEKWPEFDATAWAELKARASGRILPETPASIVGSDRDAGAIAAATANAERAGVAADVKFRTEAVSAVKLGAGPGLVVTNPPYGVRVGRAGDLRDLYARLGTLLRERWTEWAAAILVAGPMPEREMGGSFVAAWQSNNGGIPIQLLTRP